MMKIGNSEISNKKLEFVYRLIEKDFHCMKYLSQMNILRKVLPQSDLNSNLILNRKLDHKLVKMIVEEICKMCFENSDFSIFIQDCLSPLKQLLIYCNNHRDKALLEEII